MNKEEINEAIKLIKEPIIVNSVEYKYFSQENYEKLLGVYENCRWFIDNYEQVLQNIENLQQELQRKDNEIKQLREDIVNHIKIASEYKEQMIIKNNNWNELKEWTKKHFVGTLSDKFLDKMNELEGKNDINTLFRRRIKNVKRRIRIL